MRYQIFYALCTTRKNQRYYVGTYIKGRKKFSQNLIDKNKNIIIWSIVCCNTELLMKRRNWRGMFLLNWVAKLVSPIVKYIVNVFVKAILSPEDIWTQAVARFGPGTRVCWSRSTITVLRLNTILMFIFLSYFFHFLKNFN